MVCDAAEFARADVQARRSSRILRLQIAATYFSHAAFHAVHRGGRLNFRVRNGTGVTLVLWPPGTWCTRSRFVGFRLTACEARQEPSQFTRVKSVAIVPDHFVVKIFNN